MNRKSFLVLSILLFLPFTVLAFSDVDNSNIHKEAIDYLQNKNVIGGYTDGTFRPNDTINRAEFTKIVIGALSADLEKGSTCFSDVEAGAWYAPYVCTAQKLQIIGGYPDGTFQPAKEINFPEAMKILTIAYSLPIDDSLPNPWYENYFTAFDSLHYLPTDYIYVDQKVNRGQMAEMVWRILEEKNDLPHADKSAIEKNVCLKINDDVPTNFDLAKVRETWLNWYNEVRGEKGLNLYANNEQLERTATEWSQYMRDNKAMEHKRPGTTSYYDYAAIENWFRERGLTFANVNRITFTENIGKTYYTCNDSDCTDEILAGLRITFDYYMAEADGSKSTKAHYQSIVQPYFNEIGMGLAFDGRYIYVTTHYATKITSSPAPICE